MVELTSGLIDVFADTPLSGNPLAVVDGADALPDDTLRRIAGEFNQAETTFLLKSTRADWKLRSFTAKGAEIFGAGHNALGAWLWLAEHGALGALTVPKTFQQEIGPAVLPITLETRAGRIHGRMKQSPLRLSPPLGAVGPLAEALGLPTADVLTHPAPLVANTGTGHLLARVRDSLTVDRARPVTDKLLAVLAEAGAQGCYVYAFDPAAPRTAYARFFNPTVGLWEDAATGTAAGPLCAYLGSEGLLADDKALVVEQGVHLGRRSLLHVRLTPEPEISGFGVVVLRGLLTLS
ncbi:MULTISPECIES: PhzF family phenazine biosynthesis protein [Corallococcus]|uniref:PhzF family phenazine biosynthesis protein n=1 Tax=Corallococcus TaxID=83461 RepID=UPI00117C361A|nr:MULTISPECIES: PhzF family phenazine biosynthesis protein [Corallococcus]NBD08391.1 PhzF family phenazine biosynthesis isomerase [Corallococcus silvisoli]TSC34339.1 PhzF family phenazine biosynthesis protein [Corallococcus sp. Z5C101001]